MADSAAFEAACACLEQVSSLTNIEARGTIRLALKEAGFDAKTATPSDLATVARRVLPAELRSRRVDDPEAVSRKVAFALEGMTAQPAAETPEAVFERLGRS